MSGTGTCYFRINVFGFYQLLFVVCMYDRFFGCHKSCSHLNCFCTQHKCCSHSSSICNSSGCNHRCINGICHLWHQCHGCSGTDMATGFHSLCHNSICATADHEFCHSYTCYYRNYFNTCFFPEAHEFGWISGSCCDNRNLLLNYHLCHFRCIRIHQHDIYTKWFAGAFLHLANLLPNHFRWSTGCTDNTKSTCFRYCSSQMIFCNPCHSALDNRLFYS